MNDMKHMKNCLLLLTCMVSLFLTGCSGSDDEPAIATEIKTSADGNGLTFAKNGGSLELFIQADGEVEVSSNQSWCKVEPSTTTSTKLVKYNVTAEANTETDDREALISVTSGKLSKSVQVVQSAADGLIVAKTSYEVKPEGETLTISYTTNGEPEISIEESWIKQIANTRASMQEKSLQFEVTANYGSDRTGYITFSLGDKSEKVTVSQKKLEITSVGMESDALTLAAKLYTGINIGNTLEAVNADSKTAGETMWGNPQVTLAYIEGVKKAGFNAVRIPCAWDYYIEDQTTYKLKESWLNRVNEVVGYCVSNDLYAIVNIHWDGGWLENNCTADKQEENTKKQYALWKQIAEKLNHYDEHLLLAGCNEPNVENAEQMKVLKAYEQAFVDAVRETGGNNAVRNLIVQGPSTNIDKTVELFSLPEDVVPNRLLVEVHYYDPWNFCGMDKDEEWGKMSYYWGDYMVSGSDRNSTWGDESHVRSQFKKMKNKFADQGIPMILGEYGVIIRTGLGDTQEAHDKSRQQWHEVVTREAKNHGLVPFLWDIGVNGCISRYTGETQDNYVLDGIMKGAAEGNYPF
ncbi:MAG: cellulase family glycosylhydrolase [Bacteroides sp.]|nr:cellulase family glycosylhydrolase [Bacteroides sp.]